ncbi:MUS81 endonuclease, partial [Amia calva]|nr:MUS81 endonuclease [Amia calva]
MAPGTVRLGRKRPVPACPNPLFLRWLTELRDTAAQKGQQTQHSYNKAISSLRRYPLPLRSGREAKILQNFGDGICRLLDQRLEQHYAQHGPDAPIHSLPEDTNPAPGPTHPRHRHRSADRSQDPTLSVGGASPPKRKKGGVRVREYVPQKSSGGYAVLLTLYRHEQAPGSQGFLLKSELQREAQPLCDKSFTVPEPGSRYTAWSSVSTLIQRELVMKTHSPARYSLTEKGQEEEEEGEETADTLSDCSVERPPRGGGEETGPSGSGNSQASEVSQAPWMRGPDREPEVTLHPGNYDIILGAPSRKQELVTELRRNGVPFDVRKLHVGDFLWVAKERVGYVPGQLRAPPARELVLDVIVERKRMDDLCSSIIDGRFREQKFRLKRCGLGRPVYLVEESRSTAHLSLPESTLRQAIVNTQVVDGFQVRRTADIRESVAYLTVMTRQLQRLYQVQTACVCVSVRAHGLEESVSPLPGRAPPCSLLIFTEFNQGAVKNKAQTVREVFARQLMQISGVSGDKAAALLERYSTVSSLLQAYAKCPSDQEREKLLATVRYGKLQR